MPMRIDRVPDDDEAGGLPPLPVARPRLIEPLTARELEILALVCDGASNQEICTRLGIGLPTVKFHVTNVFAKLGVRRRTQAVALAVHLQLVRPDWIDARPGVGVAHLLIRPNSGSASQACAA